MKFKHFLICILLSLSAAAPAAALTKTHVPGCWYGEQRLDGTLTCLVRDSHIHTNTLGPIPLPEGNDNVLGLRVSPLGELLIAGQSHHGHGNVEWRAGTWRIVGPSYGLNPVLYDYQNRLHIGAPHLGSQGLRFAEPATGRIWTGDETYADHGRRIGEWTECNGVTVGQSGWSAAALVDGKRYTLERGSIVNIRMTCDGPNYAIYYHRQDDGSGFGLLLNRGEFSTFPEEKDPTIAPPPPIEVCGDHMDNDGDGLVDEECPTEAEPQRLTYDLGPLSKFAQERWNELPHGTRHEQAAALHRILYEFRQRTGDPIEVFRKGCTDTTHRGADGHCYAEDIVVINEGANGKWYKDAGVAFGHHTARLDFGGEWLRPNGNDAANCFPPPAPEGHTDPTPDPDPDPNPEPVPEPSPIDARVKKLEELLAADHARLWQLVEEVQRLTERLATLERSGVQEERVRQLLDEALSNLVVKGNTGRGDWGHRHPIDLPVVRR